MATIVGGKRRARVVFPGLAAALVASILLISTVSFGSWRNEVSFVTDRAVAATAAAAAQGHSGVRPSAKQYSALPLPRWDHVPDGISLEAQIPAWAGCDATPCLYTEMVDGKADTSVSYWKLAPVLLV
jgi:hypothetical protein